ncbi:MAG: hypothetical protein V1734_04745 [Nanoarchaeota archaeon]
MNARKVVKITSAVVLGIAVLWFLCANLLALLHNNYLNLDKYEQVIKGEKSESIFGMGCETSLADVEEGIWCNEYPELAGLDGEPEYSATEKMITRAIQVHNDGIQYAHYSVSILSWFVLVLALVVIVNLVYDRKAKK